jgi:hypothetical protein
VSAFVGFEPVDCGAACEKEETGKSTAATVVPASSNARNLRSVFCTNSSPKKLGSVLEPLNESELPKIKFAQKRVARSQTELGWGPR